MGHPSSYTFLVGVNLGMMESIGRKMLRKTIFSTVWQTEENRKEGKPGRLFFVSGLEISSSQIERKSLERKFIHSTFTMMPSLTYPHSWPSHLSHLMTLAQRSLSLFFLFSSYLHSTPTSSGPVLFFFFFQRDLLLPTIFLLVTKSFAELNLYVHYCNFYIIII